jgi:hypothetical protein
MMQEAYRLLHLDIPEQNYGVVRYFYGFWRQLGPSWDPAGGALGLREVRACPCRPVSGTLPIHEIPVKAQGRILSGAQTIA